MSVLLSFSVQYVLLKNENVIEKKRINNKKNFILIGKISLIW